MWSSWPVIINVFLSSWRFYGVHFFCYGEFLWTFSHIRWIQLQIMKNWLYKFSKNTLNPAKQRIQGVYYPRYIWEVDDRTCRYLWNTVLYDIYTDFKNWRTLIEFRMWSYYNLQKFMLSLLQFFCCIIAKNFKLIIRKSFFTHKLGWTVWLSWKGPKWRYNI